MIGEAKIVRHEGADVEVSCAKVSNETCPVCSTVIGKSHCHSYRFTARVGNTTFHHALTVGPVDGEISVPSKEQFQMDFDAARKYAARHAHFHHQIEMMEKEID